MARPPQRPWTVPDGRTSLVVKLSKAIVEEAVHAIVDGKPRARLLWDEKLTGFGVYVGRGDPCVRTYFAQRRVHGVAKRTMIDKHGVVTLDQARKRAHKLLVEKGEGVDHAELERKERAQGITFGESLDAHLQDMTVAKCSPRTMSAYRKTLETYSHDWLARPIAAITRADVKERHRKVAADVKAGKHAARLKHRQKDGRRKGAVIKREGKDGQVTANLWARIGRAVYQTALNDNEQLPPNPFVRIKPFKIERERRGIKSADMPAMWRDINGCPNPIKKDILTMALFTGLRRASAAELRDGDVDLEQRVLTVRRPKGGLSKRFDIPMSSYLTELLRTRRENNAKLAKQGIIARNSVWMFPCFATNPSKSGHVVELDIEAAEWAPHDLRRAFITTAESIDASKYSLRCLVNHSQPKDDQTGHYIQIEVERLRPVVERITDKLLRLVEPKKALVVPISKSRAKGAKARDEA
jgi:integrase